MDPVMTAARTNNRNCWKVMLSSSWRTATIAPFLALCSV